MKRFITLILISFLFHALQAQQLVAYYPFNLNTNDQSPNHINPTYVGPFIDYGSDRFGHTYGALMFDGNVGSYLRMPADSLPTGNRTVSLWFKTATVTNRPQLLSYGGNSPATAPGTSFLMGINSSGSNAYQTQGHYNTNLVSYAYPQEPLNQWTHFVVTIEGSTTKIFINGELKTNALGSFTSPTAVAGKDFALGVMVNSNGTAPYTDVNGGYFKGLMDDVRIYEGAMTDQQVGQLYKLEVTGLMAYYPFNGNANDESGNGNHGVVNGASLTTDRFGNPGKAYRFNNPNHIVVNNSNLFSNEFSVSYWFKIPSYFGQRASMSNVATPNGGFQQYWDGATFSYAMGYNFIGGFSPDFFSSNQPMQQPANNWHHVVVTYTRLSASASQTRLYVNGDFIRTDLQSLPINFTPNAPFFIGQNHSGINFEGDLDDIFIYNRVLNDNEIRQLTDAPMLPDLLAWLPCNGNAKDVSGSHRDGTVYGNSVLTTDKYKNVQSAYQFTSPESGISLANSGSLDFAGQPFAISAWVKYSETPAADFAVVSKHNCGTPNGYVLSIYNNTPRFYLSTGNWSTISAQENYNDNNWHHLVATYDGAGEQKLYVDGQLKASASSVVYNNPAGSGTPIIIGDANGNCGGPTIDGSVDEVKIYGSSLDSLQVKALFRQSRGSGNALSFSEPGQTRLDLDTTMIGNIFTIDAWVKTPGAEGPQYVVQGNASESWSFGMQNNRLVMKKGAMPTLTSANLPTLYNNQWHHIATSVATDQCRFYFDGELVGSIDFTVGTTEASTYQLGHYLNGTMDEVRIWDRAINLTQIRQWMNRKITSGHPQYTNLVHYFTFDEPNFTSAMDMVGGTPAILVNNPQFGPSGAPIGDTAVISFDPVGTQGLELVLAGSDSMKILGWAGSPTGIAIYAVLDAPANPKGTQGLGGNDHYFGTKTYGDEIFSVAQLYKYGNNPMVTPLVQPTVALYYRQNNSTPQWGTGVEVNHNPAIKQFFSPGPEGEWVLGSTGLPLEVKDLTAQGKTKAWTVYPNPVSETLYLRGFQGQAVVTLRDVAGRMVMPPSTLQENQGLSVSKLNPGMYFLEIREGKQRYAGKILIQQR